MLTGITVAEIEKDGGYTTLALALDRGMANDPEARARYLTIYGEEWIPLYRRGANVSTESTRAGTVR